MSLGLRWLGLVLAFAMNHNKYSLATHQRNFPDARHECIDIQAVPDEQIKLFPATDISVWGAECKFHSTSSGEKLLHQGQRSLWSDMDEEKPHVERSRSTMREVVRWATAMKEHHTPYRALLIENVPEVMLWGGIKRWYKDMYALGYRCQTICFNSMFAQAALSPSLAEQVYPVAQSRNRWYTVCTQLGNPAPDLSFRPRGWCSRCTREVQAEQVWKECARQRAVEVIGQTILWGDYGDQYLYYCPLCDKEMIPYYTPASAMIDWSLPMQRIGDRQEPLAENTAKRIRKGLQRFCPEGKTKRTPFLVDIGHTRTESPRVSSIWQPMNTQTTAQTIGMVVPPHQEDPAFIFHTLQTPWDITHQIEQIRKQKTRQGKKFTWQEKEHLIATLAEQYQGQVRRYLEEFPVYANAYITPPPFSPLLEQGFMASYHNGSDCLASLLEPVRTCDSRDRHGICLPPSSFHDTLPALEECFYRMLKSKEVKRAMGIPESYIIEATSQEEETRQCGLAVTPAVATLIMLPVLASLGEEVTTLLCA